MRNEEEEKLAEKSEQIKKKYYSRKRVRNTYTHTLFF